MTTEAIILLVARFGIPLAEQIYNTIAKSGQPTPEMWAELRQLNTKKAEDYFNVKAT